MKRRSCGVPNQSCRSWTLFLCKRFLLPINLHICWPRYWKGSIQLVLQQHKSLVFPARCTVPSCNMESGTGKGFACGFRIRNSALGIRSPAKLDWNSEFKFHWQVLRSIVESLNNLCLLLNNTVWNLNRSLSLKKVKKSLVSLIHMNYFHKLFLLSRVGKTSLTFWRFDYLRQV